MNAQVQKQWDLLPFGWLVCLGALGLLGFMDRTLGHLGFLGFLEVPLGFRSAIRDRKRRR